MELCHKHRPKTLATVVGQPEAVKVLKEYLTTNTLPHTILFTGPPGTGKTTLARILADRLCGKDSPNATEINCAACDPMDTIRAIIKSSRFRALDGKPVVWVYDEFQSLSRAGFAQQACLKPFEDVPDHVYHFLCTTDPSKVIAAIKSRATEIKTKLVDEKAMTGLLERVCANEKGKCHSKIIARIVEVAEGSPRRALVLLDVALAVPPAERLAALGKAAGATGEAIELPRALIKPNARWYDVAEVLRRLKGEDPERLRRLVTSYCSSVLLGGKSNPRAVVVLQAFREPVFVGFDDVVAMAHDACRPS